MPQMSKNNKKIVTDVWMSGKAYQLQHAFEKYLFFFRI